MLSTLDKAGGFPICHQLIEQFKEQIMIARATEASQLESVTALYSIAAMVGAKLYYLPKA